jgi:hypothetical protein
VAWPKKKKGMRCWAGGRRRWASVGRCARGKEGRRPERVCGLKEKGKGMGVGPVGRKGREGFLFLKLFSNSFFKLSNFNQTRNHAFES